jgi:PAS domain S-box-containing protein
MQTLDTCMTMCVSEKILQYLIDDARAMVLLLDPALRIRLTNRATSQFFCQSKEACIGNSVSQILGHEAFSKLRSIVSKLEIDGESAQTECRVQDYAGEVRILSLSLRLIKNEGNPSRLIVLTMIPSQPDRKRRFAGIDPEMLIRRLLQGISDSVLLVDFTDKTIQDCNMATETLFGYSREELIGRSPQFLAPSEELAKSYAENSWLSSIRAGIYQARMLCKRKDGSRFLTLATNIPLFNSLGEIVYTLAINRDISSEQGKNERIAQISTQMAELANLIRDNVSEPSYALDSKPLSGLGLSPRQVRIAALVARGDPTKAISASLGVSESAVKSQLSIVYKKLGVSSRVEFLRTIHDKRIRLE